jgi:hypothetical protein
MVEEKKREEGIPLCDGLEIRCSLLLMEEQVQYISEGGGERRNR